MRVARGQGLSVIQDSDLSSVPENQSEKQSEECFEVSKA